MNVVLFGDSITFAWPNPTPATRRHSGVPGETAVAMERRFARDAMGPKPRLLHIMAGTNDIAENDGPYVESRTVRAIGAMAALAASAGVPVLLASVPPASAIPWRPDIDAVPRIASLNRAIAAWAEAHGHRFVDYLPSLGGDGGAMLPGLSTDGLHPSPAGYGIMERILTAALLAASSARSRDAGD